MVALLSAIGSLTRKTMEQIIRDAEDDEERAVLKKLVAAGDAHIEANPHE